MSKIKNIGVLDIREISEEVAEKITEIKNIGMLIESDKSQVLLKDAKKTNIGATLKIPSDKKISLVMQNGSLEVDKEFLEGIEEQAAFLVNGELVFKSDIDINLLKEKLFTILVNGELICPRKLSGAIQSKGTINGALTSYSSDHIYISRKVQLNNGFLKSLKKESKLSFEKLVFLEPIDIMLLEERISNIEVLGKLIIFEDYEDEISPYIENYFSINKVVIPNIGTEVKYIDKSILIDNEFIKKYNEAVLYVDGKVTVELDENIDFGKHIKLLICNKVICNRKAYDIIKDNIGQSVDIEVIEGKIVENTGNMVLSGIIEEEITIRNMGRLNIDLGLDIDSFTEKVLEIKNYGLIEVPEDKLSIIRDKVKENKGKIMSSSEKKEMPEDEDVLYSNMGELKL